MGKIDNILAKLCDEQDEFRKLFRDTYREKGHFGYVPSEPNRLIKLLRKVNHKKGSFCDSGCGYPAFPIIAKELGFEKSVGIENFKPYIEVLKPKFGGIIIDEDIFLHDYSEYDVIYSYLPVYGDLLIIYLRMIISQMKKGSLFVLMGYGYFDCSSIELELGFNLDAETGLYYIIK